jgi:hypothetical protein
MIKIFTVYKQSKIMKSILFSLIFFLGLSTITTAQTSPEELGQAVIQSFIDKDENAFYQLIPTCEEIVSYIKEINLPLNDDEMQSFQASCPVSTASFKSVYVKNYKTGIQRGIDWNNVIIDEVSASSQKADEFEFDVTSVNIIAHCDDRLIEITIKNAFAVNGSWKLNDKVEFSF